jgi:membrane protein required for colicin V production
MLSQWTFMDFLFTVIILLSIGFAVLKGLIREITSLVALVGGFILATVYYADAARWLSEFARNDSVANLLGFMLIFLGCILVGAIISFIANRFMKAAKIKWVDRILGGVFGLLRGWAICSILIIGIISFPIRDRVMTHSVLAPFLLAGARAAIHVVPQKLETQFNEQYKRVLQAWNESRGAQ